MSKNPHEHAVGLLGAKFTDPTLSGIPVPRSADQERLEEIERRILLIEEQLKGRPV